MQKEPAQFYPQASTTPTHPSVIYQQQQQQQQQQQHVSSNVSNSPTQRPQSPFINNASESRPIPGISGTMPQYGGYANGAYPQTGQPTDVVTPGFQPNHAYHVTPGAAPYVQNGMQGFQPTYANMAYSPGRNSSYPPVVSYVVPPGAIQQAGTYGNNVVIAPHPGNPAATSQQQHTMPNQQPRTQHIYNIPANVHAPQQQQQQHMQQQQQQQQQEKKRPTIKLTDPNTGKDLTNEILNTTTKKKQQPVVAAAPANPTPNTAEKQDQEDLRAKTAALFAAKVAEKIASTTTTTPSEAVVMKAPQATPQPTTVTQKEKPAAVPSPPVQSPAKPPAVIQPAKPPAVIQPAAAPVATPVAESATPKPTASPAGAKPTPSPVVATTPVKPQQPAAVDVPKSSVPIQKVDTLPTSTPPQQQQQAKVLPTVTPPQQGVTALTSTAPTPASSAALLTEKKITQTAPQAPSVKVPEPAKNTPQPLKKEAESVPPPQQQQQQPQLIAESNQQVPSTPHISTEKIAQSTPKVTETQPAPKIQPPAPQSTPSVPTPTIPADKPTTTTTTVASVAPEVTPKELGKDASAALKPNVVNGENCDEKPKETTTTAEKQPQPAVPKETPVVFDKPQVPVVDDKQLDITDKLKTMEIKSEAEMKIVVEEKVEDVVVPKEVAPVEKTVVAKEVVEEETVEVVQEITTEALPDTVPDAVIPASTEDISAAKNDKPEIVESQAEVTKSEESGNKEEAPVVKESPAVKDTPTKEALPNDAPSLNKDTTKEETKPKTDKKEPMKEAPKKEDAINRFAPSFSSAKTAPSATKEDAINRFAPAFSSKPKHLPKADSPKKTAQTDSSPLVNGMDDAVKQQPAQVNPVAKKKKGKDRFKGKEAVNNDLLSAFTDMPEKKNEPTTPKSPLKSPAKKQEEETWEDKENTIEQEDVRGADAEDDAAAPKRVGGPKFVKSASLDGKHQYDRDFLLKFQFNPACTSKPENLPDIDIVLETAHAPTKPVVPGQNIGSANNFMPTFMRQSSGSGGARGHSQGGGGRNHSRDNKGGGGGGGGGGRGSQQRGGEPPRVQKIINIPLMGMEKLELKKTENEWVRSSAKEKNLSEEERVMSEVNRSVCSILNKLTPQKFKPLVQQMMDLKLDNSAKLECAITLIFQKAISEPGFSVAYANMCRVLTDRFTSVPMVSDDPSKGTVTFRKILLNKCQAEFEKEKEDDKLIEEARAKVFEKEEEKKLHLEELDYQERMNRRRTLGNIRFIGELYKLKMISEPIMHDCIYKLLRAEKQDSLEDQLECLCKLLATIGKMIDHPKAKPRMDQYFEQMHRIIDKRKISSRIKFALKDVIDLRTDDWVPRHDDKNPKTIDQIHKEAQEKEKQEEKARQQDKISKKLEPRGGSRGGGGGRDSPLARPGSAPQNADGWNTVPTNKSRAIAAAPVDASKLRFKKADVSEISLGPGGGRGAWSKGASGGSAMTRSGSGGAPSSDSQPRGNRFDALSDADGGFDPRSRQGGGTRRQMSGGGRGGGRNDALRAVQDFTGRGSRNQSPAPGGGSRNQSPAPRGNRNQSPAPRDGGRNQSPYGRRPQSPAPRGNRNESPFSRTPAAQKPTSPTPAVSDEKMRKVTKSTIEEFLGCKDYKEAILCITELKSPSMHPVFVEESITLVIEKKSADRREVGLLLNRMLSDRALDIAQLCKGLSSIVEFAPDFAVDIPHIYKYLGEVIGPLIHKGLVPLPKITDCLKPLIEVNKAGVVMAESLLAAVNVIGNEEAVALLWQNSQLTWDKLLASGEDVNMFVKDRKVEFTTKTKQQQTNNNNNSSNNSSSNNKNSPNQLHEEMLRILNQNNNNDDLITYIDSSVRSEDRSTPRFIQSLTTAVCFSSITRDASNNCQCRSEVLKKRGTVLLKYINGTKKLELEALFALQGLLEELSHPRGILRAIFDELYHGDIISEETFFEWETSKECPVGKGPALSSAKDFLTWLRKADEESNDEEAVTTS